MMVRSEKKHRIIFIDLMRAFAVFQMVQGHTIDALLAPEFRSDQYPVYFIWNFMRGMTAPIFMFTAGTVFTYLFRLANDSFYDNPRVKKGFFRFLLLVFLGYLLRYPTFKLIDFSDVTQDRLNIFFAVDVLQLIGFGILFLMIAAYIAEKLKLSDTIIFTAISMIFFLATPFIIKINWMNYFPQVIAGYFYTGTGSLFPLFPWAGYVVLGGVLGSYLAKKPLVFKTNRFSFNLALFGVALLFVSFVSDLILVNYFKVNFEASSYNLHTIIFRIGFLFLLNGIFSFISQKIDSIPRIIILVGRNTLIIYVVHLIIIYGSAWNPGISNFLGGSLEISTTILSAVIMLTLMAMMVILLSKFKFRNKQLVT